MPIKSLKGRMIYDCTGIPTIEVEIKNDKGDTSVASVAGGTIISSREAIELRDNELRFWQGKGVNKAVDNINNVISHLFVNKEIDEANQEQIDKMLIELDRTPDKSRMGSNALSAVSMAMARLGALKEGIPLYQHLANLSGKTDSTFVIPVPIFPMIGGGKYFNSEMFLKEISVVPTGTGTFAEAIRAGTEIHQQLRFIVAKNYGASQSNPSLRGQFCPHIKTVVDGLELMKKAIEGARYTGLVKVAISPSAHNFFEDENYNIDFKSPLGHSSWLDSESLADFYRNLLIKYSIVSIEDPFHFDDLKAWTSLTEKSSVQIVGNKLLCTNPNLVKQAIEKDCCNSAMIKLNQIGTVTEAIEVFKMTRKAHWSCIISDRTHDTEDTFIADLAVGLSAGQFKAGAPCRYERIAKYNQILRIEEKLGSKASFAGTNFRKIF